MLMGLLINAYLLLVPKVLSQIVLIPSLSNHEIKNDLIALCNSIVRVTQVCSPNLGTPNYPI